MQVEHAGASKEFAFTWTRNSRCSADRDAPSSCAALSSSRSACELGDKVEHRHDTDITATSVMEKISSSSRRHAVQARQQLQLRHMQLHFNLHLVADANKCRYMDAELIF